MLTETQQKLLWVEFHEKLQEAKLKLRKELEEWIEHKAEWPLEENVEKVQSEAKVTLELDLEKAEIYASKHRNNADGRQRRAYHPANTSC